MKYDENDVKWSEHKSVSGKKGVLSRKLKTTSAKITASHPPSGILVIASIESGHYSKKEYRNKVMAAQIVLESKLKRIVESIK